MADEEQLAIERVRAERRQRTQPVNEAIGSWHLTGRPHYVDVDEGTRPPRPAVHVLDELRFRLMSVGAVHPGLDSAIDRGCLTELARGLESSEFERDQLSTQLSQLTELAEDRFVAASALLDDLTRKEATIENLSTAHDLLTVLFDRDVHIIDRLTKALSAYLGKEDADKIVSRARRSAERKFRD